MERYINFKTAKFLKQIGFREPCRRCYDNNGDVAIEYLRPALPFRYADKDIYLCPTQAEVMEWLRLKHKIFIEVNVSCDHNGDYHYSNSIIIWKCKVSKEDYDPAWGYEDATESAIISVLNHLDIWKDK